jgi:hypothetical protein
MSYIVNNGAAYPDIHIVNLLILLQFFIEENTFQ